MGKASMQFEISVQGKAHEALGLDDDKVVKSLGLERYSMVPAGLGYATKYRGPSAAINSLRTLAKNALEGRLGPEVNIKEPENRRSIEKLIRAPAKPVVS